MTGSTAIPPQELQSPRQRRRVALAVFVLAFAIAVGFQVHSGAWRSDFGGHPDEAAHVVTSLMARDYLATGLWRLEHPMRFAEDYYQRFPKVALGHYPPAFYALHSVWLLPWRGASAFLVMACLITALATTLTWSIGRRILPAVPAGVAALLFLLLPLTRTYTAIVMSDLLLVVFCLAATMAFARFLETDKARYALWFGFLAAAAILTKGSGLLLALVPPAMLLLSGRLSWLKNPRLWLAPLPVLILAMPWTLATRHISAEGMSALPFITYLTEAAAFYPPEFRREFGIAAILLMLVAALLKLPGVRRKESPGRERPIDEVALWSLLLATLGFYLMIPSGFDSRYFLPAAPAICILSIRGAVALAARLRPSSTATPLSHRWHNAVAIAGGIFLLALVWRPVEKIYTGASETIATIMADSSAATPIKVLVSSDSNGEGAVVAAAALQGRNFLHTLRGSKALASSDWLGRGYEMKFTSVDETVDFLTNEAINYIIVDTDIPLQRQLPSQALLEDALDSRVTAFPLIDTVVSHRRRQDAPASFRIFQSQTSSHSRTEP